MLRCIPVERERGTHPEIDCVKKHLLNGSNAIIFPEGARSRDGGLLPLKKALLKLQRIRGFLYCQYT
ncbi:MAG: 1-acyl-sn-glycerol-3-phosphate acyltransferase [Clostridium sp.]